MVRLLPFCVGRAARVFHLAVACVGGTACNLLEYPQEAAGPLRSQDRLLNRMNSAFFRYLLSREKREHGIHRTVRIHAKPLLQRPGIARSQMLRVDSRTTSSGATLRWLAATSRFSSTDLMPSRTIPTAPAPIASIGWRTVVSGGV